MFSKSSNSANRIVVLLLGICLISAQQASAQQDLKDYYDELTNTSQNINASQTQWKKHLVEQPSPSLDVEKMVARGQAAAKQRGASDADISQIGEVNRQIGEQSKAGTEQTTLFSCVHQGSTTWCEIAGSLSVPLNSPPGKLESYRINYDDGQNIISVDRAVLKPGQMAKDVLWVGTLNRQGKYVMADVGKENLPFLVGTPYFGEELPRFRLVKQNSETVTVEMPLDKPSPRVLRVVVSKVAWRPVSEEMINQFNQKAIWSRSWEQYQQYSGNVWFPTQVVTKRFRSTGALYSTETYELLEAKFNDSADTSILKKPFPVGARISDYRFHPKPEANYKIRKGGIPGDATVLKLVEKREANAAAAKRQQQLSTARNIALPTGALLLVGGLIWWRRSRQTST